MTLILSIIHLINIYQMFIEKDMSQRFIFDRPASELLYYI